MMNLLICRGALPLVFIFLTPMTGLAQGQDTKRCFEIYVLESTDSDLELAIKRRMSLQLEQLGLKCPRISVNLAGDGPDTTRIVQYVRQARRDGFDLLEEVFVEMRVWRWDRTGEAFDVVIWIWDRVYRISPGWRDFLRNNGSYVIHWTRNSTPEDVSAIASGAVDNLLRRYDLGR